MRRCCLGLLALAAAACGDNAPRAGSAVVRDSAGVRIVENTTPAADLPVWTLAEQPRLQLGAVEGDSAEQFFRVTGAVRLDDGRIAVANAGTQELRLFAAGGGHLRSAGGPGEGPGEYRGMRRLWRLPDDSLLVEDYFGGRLMLYSADAVLERSWRIAPPPGGNYAPPTIGRLAGGDYVVESGETSGGPLGLLTYTTVLLRYSPEGQPQDTIAAAPGGQTYVSPCDASGNMICNDGLPFARTRAAAVGGDRAYLGNGATYEIRVFTDHRGLTGLWRWNVLARAVTGEDVNLYREYELQRARDENGRRRIERLHGERPIPDVMPMYSTFFSDTDQNLWVEDYRPPYETSIRYTVFDPSGTVTARFTLPPGLAIMDVGSDYLLAVWKDEFDVEYVRLYDLLKVRN